MTGTLRRTCRDLDGAASRLSAFAPITNAMDPPLAPSARSPPQFYSF